MVKNMSLVSPNKNAEDGKKNMERNEGLLLAGSFVKNVREIFSEPDSSNLAFL